MVIFRYNIVPSTKKISSFMFSLFIYYLFYFIQDLYLQNCTGVRAKGHSTSKSRLKSLPAVSAAESRTVFYFPPRFRRCVVFYIWAMSRAACFTVALRNKLYAGAYELEHATPLYFCHGVFIDRFIFRSNSSGIDSRGSAMINHKKLIDVTASLERNYHYCPRSGPKPEEAS